MGAKSPRTGLSELLNLARKGESGQILGIKKTKDIDRTDRERDHVKKKQPGAEKTGTLYRNNVLLQS